MQARLWRWMVFASLLWLSASACTSTGKCRRGDLGCACRTEGSCASGAVCAQGMCIKSTAGRMMDGNQGGAGSTPPLCAATTLDGACRAYCLATCRGYAAFCASGRCEADSCEPNGGVEFRPTCEVICGKERDPVGCMRNLCVQQTRMTCTEFGFETDAGTFETLCPNNDPMCTTAP